MGALPLGMLVLFCVIPLIDPKGNGYARAGKFYQRFVAGVTLLMIAISWLPELTVWGVIAAKGSTNVIVSVLIGALLVGVSSAKALSYALDIPLVKVNHIEAHIAANYLEHDIEPPFVALVASGGHTSIVRVDGYNEHRLLAATTDDAIGEAFDKVARLMGLDYPGGASVDKLAAQGQPRIPLTKHKLVFSDGNVSYSGLKTAVINIIHNAGQKGESYSKEDLSACVRKKVCDILVKKTMLAADRFGFDKVAVAGGVSANSLLRRELEKACKVRKKDLFCPELKYCADNAAMVGVQGFYELSAKNTSGMDLNAKATKSIEE